MSEASHRSSRAALVGLAALAPFNVKVTSDSWTDLQLRLLVIVALIVVLVLAFRSLRLPQWHRPDWIDSLAYCWLGAIWLAAFVSDDLVLGAGGAIRLSVAALLIPATRSVVQDQEDARRLMQVVACAAAAAATFGLVVWAVGSDLSMTQVFVGKVTRLGHLDRLTRPWSHANVAAIAMGASLAMGGAIRIGWLRIAVASVLIVAIVLTISRGGLLAMAAAALAWVILRRDRTEAAVVVAFVVLAASVVALSSAWTTRVDQLGDKAFYASTIDVPQSFEVGSEAELLQMAVANDSSTAWPRAGDNRVLISARWIGADGKIWTEDRWQLPHDLEPGQRLTTGLTVDARLPVGTYDVRWDLLILDTAYFGQFLGDAPIMNRIEVTQSDVEPNHFFRYDLVERSVGIGRVDGWRLAWQDFTSSPLVGVGPNQFADQATGQLALEQRAVGAHAHNLLLEPLATWGLLGTLPFLMLGVGALYRTVRAAWRTRQVVPVAIATGLVAVAAHGLVDWPLVTITTGIPIGLLVALAWSDAVVADA